MKDRVGANMSFLHYRHLFGEWRWERRDVDGHYRDSGESYETGEECVLTAQRDGGRDDPCWLACLRSIWPPCLMRGLTANRVNKSSTRSERAIRVRKVLWDTACLRALTRCAPLRTTAGAVILAFALTSEAADPQGPARLVELVNDYRSAPHRCKGSRTDTLSPLAPTPALARAAEASAHDLKDALAHEGYAARRVGVIALTGPATAESALKALEKRYCGTLTARHFADIGVTRAGRKWRIVLAQPLLREGLADWREAGHTVLGLVNAARGESRNCGKRRFAPARALRWNDKLAAAALAHSRDMAERNYFAHIDKDGSTPADRVSRHAYQWRRTGENIAAGQGSPEQVVSGWLASPHHCANIMDPRFREMGAAYIVNLQSDQTIYWTQEFGTPPSGHP